MSPVDRIRQLLSEQPGLKAQQIAELLSIDRTQVLAALHGDLSSEATQDSAYRWWIRPPHPDNGAGQNQPTFLASLCRYYLECLARESGPSLSLPVSDTAGYVAMAELPFTDRGQRLLVSDRAVKSIVQKVRRERGQLTLYAGFALRLRASRYPESDGMRMEPVLLYPLDESLRPVGGSPLFNLDVMKGLPTADSGNAMEEAIHLSEELGLFESEGDLPQWDEVIFRLQRCRPDWEWRENLNPYALSTEGRIDELTKPGIYNRAVLFAATRSPFTYGLELELARLAQLDDSAVSSTALGTWVRGVIDSEAVEDRPILEVLPLNTEQRQAVLQGLSAPLTVVTGPPGTGKSQVVATLLANMAWQGRSVLFASKNNHAVDVVESRVNGLGAYPLLLRLGRGEHHATIAQHLTAWLAESSSPDDVTRYQWLQEAHEQDTARFNEVHREIQVVVALRNRVDEMERAAEPARAVFGESRFRQLCDADLALIRRRVQALQTALQAATESSQPAMVRLLWDSVKSRRLERVSELVNELLPDAELLGIPAADAGEFPIIFTERLEMAERVQDYWSAFDALRSSSALEQLACTLSRIAEESAHNSLELWQCWMRLWPGRWSQEERKVLSEFLSLLLMITGGDRHDEGAGRRVFRRYHLLFPRVVQILPCWAVTSLSARGRFPFEPALFDLVVIDEASQCDIASALPLLFRARRAVIIGDPLQLSHVSAVAPQQDRLLLGAHGLAEGNAVWAYSVNSLFDLARSLCRHEDIVNLRDHHRSHRDIIGFSNRHFYRGSLRIATDHDALKRPEGAGPAVRWINVQGRVIRPSAGGAVNVPEAQAVLAQVRELVMDRGYTGMIGVVTPFRAQANRIRTLVHQHDELSKRMGPLQFIVDTAHGFQGDERDVIFFSPVVSTGVGESAIRFLKGHGNLFNVAITRARSELVVVGDLKAAMESGISYLASFAEYWRDLATPEDHAAAGLELGPEYPPVPHPELVSEWERVFYRALYAAGFRPVPQYDEAPFTLDFALFHGERKLNIEVDGENYHRNWDGELCRRDQIRSRRLHDLGWDVMRFWVYEIRDDLGGCIERVRRWHQGL